MLLDCGFLCEGLRLNFLQQSKGCVHAHSCMPRLSASQQREQVEVHTSKITLHSLFNFILTLWWTGYSSTLPVFPENVKLIFGTFLKEVNQNVNLVRFHKMLQVDERVMWCIGYITHGCGSKLRQEVNKPGDKMERGHQDLLSIAQVVIVLTCQLASAMLQAIQSQQRNAMMINARSTQWKQLISHVSWMSAMSEFIQQICSNQTVSKLAPIYKRQKNKFFQN